MSVRLTPAQARRLGIDVESGTVRAPANAPVPGSTRRTRTTAPGSYRTVCVLCHTSFTTRASEDRHVVATSHPRYALVFELLP